MVDNDDKPKSNPTLKILIIVIIILVIGIALYLLLGNNSSMRNDDVSLNQVKDESKNNPVVLFFWGSNCPYCDDQKPIIEDLEKEYKNTEVSFYWLDTTKHNDLVDNYNVNGVPTTVVLNKSGVEKKFIGFSDHDEIANSIDKSLESYT